MPSISRESMLGSLVRLLIVPLLLGANGCGRIALTSGTGNQEPGAAAGGTTSSSGNLGYGAGAPASLGELPGPVGNVGTSSTPPPVVALPAPAGTQDRIGQLIQRFGMKSISGSGATMDMLTRLEEAYARFPAGSFRNLAVVFEPVASAGANGQGLGGGWVPVAASGRDWRPGGGDLVAGRITYYTENADSWVLVHEVGHHVSLLLDPGFSRRVIEALGYTNPGRPYPTDLELVNEGQFAATSVAGNSYPTALSRTDALEHLAELMTYHLLGGVVPNNGQDPQFAGVPSNVRAILIAKLGTGPGQSSE